MAPTPVLLPGNSHGQRSLVGCSPWGREESDTGPAWATSLSLFTFMHWRRKWQPTPVFLPGESQERGSLVEGVVGSHRVRHDWSDLAAMLLSNLLSRVRFPQLSWRVFFFFFPSFQHIQGFYIAFNCHDSTFLAFHKLAPWNFENCFFEFWQLSPTVRHFPLWPVLRLYGHVHCLVTVPHWRPSSLCMDI